MYNLMDRINKIENLIGGGLLNLREFYNRQPNTRDIAILEKNIKENKIVELNPEQMKKFEAAKEQLKQINTPSYQNEYKVFVYIAKGHIYKQINNKFQTII
jgi:hypothetical protein